MAESRKLSAEQISQLFHFVEEKGVKFYDVQLELVDHFASEIEARWRQHPEQDFDLLIKAIYRDFRDYNFTRLLQQKKRALAKRSWRMAWAFLRTFFTWPKVMLTALLVVVLQQFMSQFGVGMEIFKWFALILLITLFARGGYLFIHRPKGKQFLVYYQTLLLVLAGVNLVALLFTQLPRWFDVAESGLSGWQLWAVSLFMVVSSITFAGFFFYARGSMLRELEASFPQYVG